MRTPDRLLLDTVYIHARLNRHDQHHARATALSARVRDATEVWVTEAVLIEVANGLSAINRNAAAEFIGLCYETDNIRVVTVDTMLLRQGLSLFGARADKQWSLTDCISFVVMQEHGITDAVTDDHHFEQAGFRALMRQ